MPAFLRRIAAYVCAIAAIASGSPAIAQSPETFPNKTIRIIVPFSAGGPTDAIARAFAQELAGVTGASVIVENRTGGDAMIGTRAALAAPADGYTLLMGTTALATTELLHKEAGFTLRDFKVVAPFGFQGFILSTNTIDNIKTLPDLVAAAKSKPGGVNNASLAQGSPMWFLAERLKQAAGVDFTNINFPGSAPAMNAVVGGHVQIIFNGPQTTLPLLRSGKLRALAVSTENRIEVAPDIPTFKELGYPDVTGANWFAVVASAKTPQAVVDKLAAAGQQAARSELVRRTLANISIQPWDKPIADFNRTIEADRLLWVRDANRLGITPK